MSREYSVFRKRFKHCHLFSKIHVKKKAKINFTIFFVFQKKLDQLVAPFPRQLRSATIGLEEFLGGKGRQSVVHYFDDQVLHLLRYFGLDFSEHFLRVFVQEIVDGFAC